MKQKYKIYRREKTGRTLGQLGHLPFLFNKHRHEKVSKFSVQVLFNTLNLDTFKEIVQVFKVSKSKR